MLTLDYFIDLLLEEEAWIVEKGYGVKHVDKLRCSLNNFQPSWEQSNELHQLKRHGSAYTKEGFSWGAFCCIGCKLSFNFHPYNFFSFSTTFFCSKLMKQQRTFSTTCFLRREWTMHKKIEVNQLFSRAKMLFSAHKVI